MIQQSMIVKILREAMQYKNPEAYKEMTKDGTLEGYLDQLAATAWSEAFEVKSEATMAITTEGNPQYVADVWERIRKIEMAGKAAEDVAIQQALEQVMA